MAFLLKAEEQLDRFAITVDCILDWISRRAGRSLPDEAWKRESFELSEIGSQRTAAVALAQPRYWAARLDDADKEVPLRTWVTEIGVGVNSDGDILFGARLICVTRGVDEPFVRSIPSFVKAVISTGKVDLDGLEPKREPRFLQAYEDVEVLVRLIEDSSRQCNVIVFSLPEGSIDSAETAASAAMVQEKLFGVAHVFILSGPASYELTALVGREFSVYRQAVRVYRPGFQGWTGQPSDHPLFLPKRIGEWMEGERGGFERWLVEQSLANSVHISRREDRLPSFNVVRQLASQEERRALRVAGGSDAEMLKLFETDNTQLRAELKEQRDQYEELLAAAEGETAAAVQDANVAKAQALELRHRVRILTERLDEATEYARTETPDSLEFFEDWCRENLVGSVELVGRAFQGVRKSDYVDPQLIYESLLLLRDYYVPMRIDSTPEKRLSYESALQRLDLEESSTGDGVKYASEQYSVQYGGTRKPLDRHLKKGDSRDRRYCFRLYFFWDDEGQVVVVGWLPSHLDNRLS